MRKTEKQNVLVIGELGRGRKVKTFREGDFKEELAPSNAKIEHHEIDGEKLVIMTYKL